MCFIQSWIDRIFLRLLFLIWTLHKHYRNSIIQTPLYAILAIAATRLLSLNRKIIFHAPLYSETKHDFPPFEACMYFWGFLAKSKWISTHLQLYSNGHWIPNLFLPLQKPHFIVRFTLLCLSVCPCRQGFCSRVSGMWLGTKSKNLWRKPNHWDSSTLSSLSTYLALLDWQRNSVSGLKCLS